MLLELAKPLTLLALILALLVLFHAAFLEQNATTLQHLEDSLAPLLLSGMAAAVAGFCFLPDRRARVTPISRTRAFWRTLPMQVLYFATVSMTLIFLAAWYVETYMIPARDLR